MSRDLEPKYLDALSAAIRDFAVFLLDTGLRVGEALKLEWPQVNLKENPGHVRIRALHTKNSKPRAIPLTPRVRDLIKQKRERSGL